MPRYTDPRDEATQRYVERILRSIHWRRVRDEFLAGAPVCYRCAAAGRKVPAAVAVHIEPIATSIRAFRAAKALDVTNLRGLCATCAERGDKLDERRRGVPPPPCPPSPASS